MLVCILRSAAIWGEVNTLWQSLLKNCSKRTHALKSIKKAQRSFRSKREDFSDSGNKKKKNSFFKGYYPSQLLPVKWSWRVWLEDEPQCPSEVSVPSSFPLAHVDFLKPHFPVLVLTALLANGLMHGQRQRRGGGRGREEVVRGKYKPRFRWLVPGEWPVDPVRTRWTW